tara:strand:+ start:2852 stop:3589 length:738 start_codon:yes stop_codon:yes gene_type:complete
MDSLTITILSIVVVTFLSAFIKGRKKDRCLKKVNGYFIHIYNSKQKTIWGRAEIESNSIVIDFENSNELTKKKFILYKNEFKNMQLIILLHSYLDKKQKLKRNRILKKFLRPGIFSKVKRKLGNVFATAKDAVNEIINLLMASAKTIGPMKSISPQGKHLDRLKDDSMGNLKGNAYEPIWEKYIGKKVDVEIKEDKSLKIEGVLVEYSQSYILLFDSSIKGIEYDGPNDLLISREYGTIRHVLSN